MKTRPNVFVLHCRFFPDWNLLGFPHYGYQERGKNLNKLQIHSEWYVKREKCSTGTNPNMFLLKNTLLRIQTDMAVISHH